MRRRLLLAAGVYGAMALTAWLCTRGEMWRSDGWLSLTRPAGLALSLVGGALLAVAVIGASRIVVRHTRWGRNLHVAFRGLLGPLSGVEIAFFALSSGFAEELFFRGAMQPAWGIALTSVLFALAHVAPDRRFLPWMLSAGVVGALLGLLVALTGEVAGAILAHVVINYENLHFIEAFDPDEAPRPRKITPPSLVGRSLRANGRGS
ncbi:MAG: CPBP family intramembrane glutamic endopeptidase [Myxococcota bacterium]